MEATNRIEWRIEISENNDGEKKFHFRKFVNDTINESYPPVGQEIASINVSCIINGFEPLHFTRLKLGSHAHPNE